MSIFPSVVGVIIDSLGAENVAEDPAAAFQYLKGICKEGQEGQFIRN